MDIGFSALTVRVVDGCETLEDAILALAKFFSVARRSLQVGLHTDHGEASLMIRADSPEPVSAYALESNHTCWLSMCLSHFLGRLLPLTGAATRDPNHMSLNRPHWSLGAPVTHDSVSAIRFPASLLSARGVRVAGGNAYWDCVRFALQPSEHDPLGVARSGDTAGVVAGTVAETFEWGGDRW